MSHVIHCEGADLCDEINGATETSFVRTYEGDPASRLILRTASFALVADMSPLIVGHLLLLPVDHYLSFAALMRNHYVELADALTRIQRWYSNIFGDPLILEHGSATSSDSNACITHAHWHIMPVDGTKVDSLIAHDELPSEKLTNIAALGSPRWTECPYYFTSHGGQHHVYTPSPKTKRQYLRSIVGQVLSINDPEWDYALVVRKELLRETMSKAKESTI